MMEKTRQYSETTPLLEVHVARQRCRYQHPALRLLSTLLPIAVILFLIPSIWSYLPWAHPLPHASWPEGNGLPYDQLQQILLNTPSAAKPGKNLSQALWTLEKWKEFGVEDTTLATYDIYLNYPLDNRLALLKKSGGNTEVTFEATLEEDVLEEDPTSNLPDRVPVFHGYSATGNVTARFVYANFGTYKDFEDLVNAGIPLEGKIAIVKYGAILRGLKVKRAQELGMVGVIIYSDPQEDGEITEENGYETYPNGPARNPSAIQRGSTQFINTLPGDPTTPGYASKPGCERQDPQNSIPSIPSLPVSYKEALPLLKALNGYGPKAEDFNKDWQGGGLGYKGVEYNIGPSPEDVVINLDNQQEYVTTPVWNVIGVIKGHIPDEVIILGNHRDAWIAGGAADPNSGSAALNEVVRSFGEALKTGWKPLRTIVFASWDGEEYGLLGSTEWVEDNLPWLSKANIAYLNVDVAAAGTEFHPSAAPLLNKVIYEVTSLVQSPNQTVPGQTVRDVWDGEIGTMGSGSDFTAFQDFAGVASLDFAFIRAATDPVYHYHSNYDSFTCMEKFGDHDWSYHIACTKLWALIAARLVESPLIAFSATDYAKGLETYLHQIEPAADNLPEGSHFDFADLEFAILNFHEYARQFDEYTADLVERLGEHVPWYKWWKKVHLLFQIRAANDKYKGLERAFLYQPGLDGRNWFKHVVFAPGIWTGYSGTTYPGLVESLEAGNLENAKVGFSSELLVIGSIVLTYWRLSEMEHDYSGKDEGGYEAAGISFLVPI
ncbi:Peptidase M28 [Penicillium riverlandense]|uniref:Peptidase M28 n=1 Tax=Penicillium riverlandense TaxID=1903569 RepID=UPI0025492F6E|nr:Peptidase M28 [Penicillium riverlandense]KAJ5811889.1 Peptidase M28 [Penicillium riverlandense]